MLDHIAAVAEERRWLSDEPPFERERHRASTLAAIDDPHSLLLAAADADDALIGELSAFGRPDRAANIGMSVAKEWRGRGVGSALLASCIEWARTNGVHKLALHVWPHNEVAIRLYGKFGFEQEGRLVRHYRRANGELWDVLVMGLVVE